MASRQHHANQKSRKRDKKEDHYGTNAVCPRDVMLNPSITTANLKKKLSMLLQDISIRTIQHRSRKSLNLPSHCADKNPS